MMHTQFPTIATKQGRGLPHVLLFLFLLSLLLFFPLQALAVTWVCLQDLDQPGDEGYGFIDKESEYRQCSLTPSQLWFCSLGAVDCIDKNAKPLCPPGGFLNGVTDKCEAPASPGCPAGYTYDSSIDSCWQTLACPSGGFLNNLTGRCELSLTDSNCPAGYQLDPDHDACVKDSDCSPGFYNSSTDHCELAPAYQCPLGYTYSTASRICQLDPPCAAGVYNPASDKCEITAQTSCPDGYAYNATLGRCTVQAVCPAGGTLNSMSDKCEVIVAYTCPSGYAYNTSHGKCERAPDCPVGSNYDPSYDTCTSSASTVCPSGLSWDGVACYASSSCPGGTLNVSTNVCEAPAVSSCPNGYAYDTSSALCEVAPTCPSGLACNPTYDLCMKPANRNCPADYRYNSTTGQCEKDPACPSGSTYNPSTGQCSSGTVTLSGSASSVQVNLVTAQGSSLAFQGLDSYDSGQQQAAGTISLSGLTASGSATLQVIETEIPIATGSIVGSGNTLTVSGMGGFGGSQVFGGQIAFSAGTLSGTINLTGSCGISQVVGNGGQLDFYISMPGARGCYYSSGSTYAGSIVFSSGRAPTTRYTCSTDNHTYPDAASCQTNCKQTANCASTASLSGEAGALDWIIAWTASGGSFDFIGLNQDTGPESSPSIILSGFTASGGINVGDESPINYIRAAGNVIFLNTWEMVDNASLYLYGATASGSWTPSGCGICRIVAVGNRLDIYEHHRGKDCYFFGNEYLSGSITFSGAYSCPLAGDTDCSGNPPSCSAPASCIGSSVCPAGHTWNGTTCIGTPSCAAGDQFVNGECQRPYQASCDQGTYDAAINSCVASYICPPGGTFNASADTCQAALLVNCPGGYTYDSSSGTCEANPQCSSGGIYDSALDLCAASATTICQPGMIYNPTTAMCQASPACPGGALNTHSDKCEANVSAQCTNGYSYDSSMDICYSSLSCAPGVFDPSLGKCKVSAVAYCPGTYLYDLATHRCTQAPVCGTGSLYDQPTNQCQMVPDYHCASGYAYSKVSKLCQVDPSCPTGTTYNSSTDNCDGMYSCPLGPDPNGNEFPCISLTSAVRPQCSPNACFDKSIGGIIDDVNQDTYQDDGQIVNNECLGQVFLFTGRADRCRTSGLETGFKSCCNLSADTVISEPVGNNLSMTQYAGTAYRVGETVYHLAQAAYYTNQAITTGLGSVALEGKSAEVVSNVVAGYAAAQEGADGVAVAMSGYLNDMFVGMFNPYMLALQGAIMLAEYMFSGECDQQDLEASVLDSASRCHFVGTYCQKKWPLIGGCAQQAKGFCCFDSELGKIIQEQGRPQLSTFRSDFLWGDPKLPDCRGFTPAEFQALDFSQPGMQQALHTYFNKQMSGIAQTAVQQMQQKTQDAINNYYNLINK